MNNKRTFDDIDAMILNFLQKNGRMQNAELARRVSMAPSAVLERVRKLERRGVIRGYEAVVDHVEAGKSLTAFTSVHCTEAVGATDTGKLLAQVSGVLEVHYCAGKDSYLVKVRARDTDELAEILSEFGKIETVRDTSTTIVLRTLKESRSIEI
jgi:Lrp/AsnC family leucine-responsive transcriptional regulator